VSILAILALIFLASIAINMKFGEYTDAGFVSVLCAIVSGLMLALALAFIPIQRIGVHASIAEFEAVRASRAGGSEIEAAAWRMKVAESNAWLASIRYYNGTAFDIWIPDEVEALKPIE
jgi:hypothetical protein